MILNIYLSTDYFGTRLIIFDNNMNTIGNHFLYQVRGQISVFISVINTWNLPSDLVQKAGFRNNLSTDI